MQFSILASLLVALIPTAVSGSALWAYDVDNSDCTGDWIGCKDLQTRTCCDWGYSVNTIQWDIPNQKTGYWFDGKHCSTAVSLSKKLKSGACTYNTPSFQSNMWGDAPKRKRSLIYGRSIVKTMADTGVNCQRPNTFGHRNATTGAVDNERAIPDGFWDEWDAEELAEGMSGSSPNKVKRDGIPKNLWAKLKSLPEN